MLGSQKLDADLSPATPLRREGMPELMHDEETSHQHCVRMSVAQAHLTHEDIEHRVDEDRKAVHLNGDGQWERVPSRARLHSVTFLLTLLNSFMSKFTKGAGTGGNILDGMMVVVRERAL